MTLTFDLKVKFTGFLICICVQPKTIFWFDICLITIFNTCVYHHERMFRVHLCSRFNIDLWPQGQIYRFLSCLLVQPVTSVCFDYLAHGSITMKGCVAYIYDPDTTLTFEMKVKFVRFMTWLCVRVTGFFSLDSHTLFGIWVHHHGTMCCIHSWPLYDLDLWPQYTGDSR